MIFCGALLLLGTSCQKKQANFATDEVMMTDANHLIVNNDSVFTGEIWDDAHRVCFEMEDGKKVKFIATHDNGKTAAIYDFETKEEKFFEIDGTEISRQEFAKKYRKLIKELKYD